MSNMIKLTKTIQHQDGEEIVQDIFINPDYIIGMDGGTLQVFNGGVFSTFIFIKESPSQVAQLMRDQRTRTYLE